MPKPFSENVVFFDTEFSTLDPYQGEILSVGMVKFSGEELYVELEHDGVVSDWVKTNVLSGMTGEKVSREAARAKIQQFLGDSQPYLVGYVTSFDSIYFYKLFGTETSPAYWIPIDFASILFGLGIDPESYYRKDKKNFFKRIGIDTSNYHEHNALDDAKLLREVYLKMSAKR